MSTAERATRRRKLVGSVALFMMLTACSSAQGSGSATTVDIQPELADPNDGIATRSEVADFIAEDFLHKPLTAAAVKNLDHSILQDDATLMCEAARTSRKVAFDTILSASLPDMSFRDARVVFLDLAQAACLDQWNNTLNNG
jgi:hypothetical protein